MSNGNSNGKPSAVISRIDPSRSDDPAKVAQAVAIQSMLADAGVTVTVTQAMGMSMADATAMLRRRIEELKNENNKLRQSAPSGGIKVSVKGAVSVYGLMKFPVTLYPEQWDRLLGMGDEIRAFIEAHRGELKFKAPAGE